jgi:hypothetical protein
MFKGPGNYDAPRAILMSVGRRWRQRRRSVSMYDYVKSRPAKVGEKLRTHRFHPGIIGFAAPEDASTAVRVLSGTELAFATTIRCSPTQFVWMEGDSAQSHDGHLSGTRQGQPANARCLGISERAKGTADLLVGGSGSNGASASSATCYSG